MCEMRVQIHVPKRKGHFEGICAADRNVYGLFESGCAAAMRSFAKLLCTPVIFARSRVVFWAWSGAVSNVLLERSNEYRIKQTVMRHYDRTTRPVRNDETTVNVLVSMSLHQILDTVSFRLHADRRAVLTNGHTGHVRRAPGFFFLFERPPTGCGKIIF